MKKMIAFFILIVFLVGLSVFKSNNFDLLKGYEKIIVVSENVYSKLDENPIKNGNQYIHSLEKEKGKYFLNNIDKFDILGLSFYFNNNFKLSQFNKEFDYTLSNPSILEEYKIYYGYYEKYDDYRLIDGKKINVQLVETQNEWIVGFPLILTGF